MNEDRSRSLDLLGVKPIGESIKIATQSAVDGASAFLSRICLPAAEEFGLALRDRVGIWRQLNMVAITRAADKKLAAQLETENVSAHPRIVGEILENGSWIEDCIVQDMWGGLLASSCTEFGDDDSNLLFTSILSQLTKLQARLIDQVCIQVPKTLTPNGLIQPATEYCSHINMQTDDRFVWSFGKLREVCGDWGIDRFDCEIDHLREMGLLRSESGFEPYDNDYRAQIVPTPLALQMYVRCQGSRSAPADFFGLSIPQNAAPTVVDPTDVTTN